MLAYHIIRMANFCLTGASATLGQGKVCWRPSRHKAKPMTVKRHTEVDGNIENMLEHYHELLSYIELCIRVAWCVLNHFDPSIMTGHILIILDTIFNRLKFPFIAPRDLFLPGQPAKFLLVPSSFRAFLASSSLLAEDLTWHVACLSCPHPTHEFPAFEHLLLPMPAIPLNSWGLRFWMAWVQMAFRSCCHYNRHLFQHTLRHWKASRLKCLDAGRVDEIDQTWSRIRHPSDMDVLMKKFRQSGTENCHLSIKLIVNHKSVWSHNHQAWCWDLGIGGASWESCMTSSTSWPSWFPQQCCFPTEAVWGAEHIEQHGVYHCHIAVSSLCCDFIVSGCRFFSPNVFHTFFQLFFGSLFFIPGRPSVLAGCPVVGSPPWYGKQIRMSWSKRGISTCWIGVPAATGNWKFTWKVRFPKI